MVHGQNCSCCTLLVFADIEDLQSSNLRQDELSEKAEGSRKAGLAR